MTKTCADFQERNEKPEVVSEPELRERTDSAMLTPPWKRSKPGLIDRRLIEKYTIMRDPDPKP
jgi:hypothetical protein